jgi:hypothetical protein
VKEGIITTANIIVPMYNGGKTAVVIGEYHCFVYYIQKLYPAFFSQG